MSLRTASSLGDEIIVAPITPSGVGAVAAVRLAGPGSRELVQRSFRPSSGEEGLQPFVLRVGIIRNSSGDVIDEVMAVYMTAGRSYTGEEQVEVFCHGGPSVVRAILAHFIDAGARAAEPGEFTKLAFLNGRLDLAQAESVADLVAAHTSVSAASAQHHLSGAYSEHVGSIRGALVALLAEIEARLDNPDEDLTPAESTALAEQLDRIQADVENLASSYRGGRILKEGFTIAIAGRPNAGKSSLFNRLLQQNRAIVAPTPGTTRDYLSEWIELTGVAVQLIDTAGFRDSAEPVERAGLESSRRIVGEADLVLWVADILEPSWRVDARKDTHGLQANSMMLLANKIDARPGSRSAVEERAEDDYVGFISCLTGEGIERLTKRLEERIAADLPDLTAGLVVTSARHQQKLAVAAEALTDARPHLGEVGAHDLAAFEIRRAVDSLDEITGRIYTEQILGEIFSRFCIGK